jgi:hypothetical protein
MISFAVLSTFLPFQLNPDALKRPDKGLRRRRIDYLRFAAKRQGKHPEYPPFVA